MNVLIDESFEKDIKKVTNIKLLNHYKFQGPNFTRELIVPVQKTRNNSGQWTYYKHKMLSFDQIKNLTFIFFTFKFTYADL